MVKFNLHVYLAKSVSPILDTNTVPFSGGDGLWHATETTLRIRIRAWHQYWNNYKMCVMCILEGLCLGKH